MSDDEIQQLKKEVEALREEVIDVREALNLEIDNTLKHFGYIHSHIVNIHDCMTSITEKVFPGYAATKSQVNELIQRYIPPPSSKPTESD
jgi:hypothetical protein